MYYISEGLLEVQTEELLKQFNAATLHYRTCYNNAKAWVRIMGKADPKIYDTCYDLFQKVLKEKEIALFDLKTARKALHDHTTMVSQLKLWFGSQKR